MSDKWDGCDWSANDSACVEQTEVQVKECICVVCVGLQLHVCVCVSRVTYCVCVCARACAPHKRKYTASQVRLTKGSPLT